MKRLILALLVTSCNAPYTLAIEQEFSLAERHLIELAISEWMVACDCDEAAIFTRYDLETTNALSYDEWSRTLDYGRMWRVSKDEPVFITRGDSTTIGCHKNGNVFIVADRIDTELKMYKVILHEFGHLYGIEHQYEGIMRSGHLGEKEACIDAFALEEFCEMHSCGPQAMSTCDDVDEIPD